MRPGGGARGLGAGHEAWGRGTWPAGRSRTGRRLQRRTESHVAHAGTRVNARGQGGGHRSIFRAPGVGTRPRRPQPQRPPPQPQTQGDPGEPSPQQRPAPSVFKASLKQTIALLTSPDVLPSVIISFSGSFPPAGRARSTSCQVRVSCKNGASGSRSGEEPGSQAAPVSGGRGLPGTPRAQPVWSRVRRGASASELGLRQQTAGAPHRPGRRRARGSPPRAALGGGFEQQHPWGAGGCPMEQRPRHSRASRIQRWMVCKQSSSTYLPWERPCLEKE